MHKCNKNPNTNEGILFTIYAHLSTQPEQAYFSGFRERVQWRLKTLDVELKMFSGFQSRSMRKPLGSHCQPFLLALLCDRSE